MRLASALLTAAAKTMAAVSDASSNLLRVRMVGVPFNSMSKSEPERSPGMTTSHQSELEAQDDLVATDCRRRCATVSNDVDADHFSDARLVPLSFAAETDDDAR
jgi:hypothetical protein